MQVHEGHVWETVTSTASTWASKVREKGSGLWSKSEQDEGRAVQKDEAGGVHEDVEAGGVHEDVEGGGVHEGMKTKKQNESSEKMAPSGRVPPKPATQFNWDETWDEQKGWDEQKEPKGKGDEQKSWDETWDEQKGWDEAQWEDVEIRTSKQN